MSTHLSERDLEELGNLPYDEQERELFRKLTKDTRQKLESNSVFIYFPPLFDKQFFCSLWEELNKTIAPEIKYNVPRSQMRRKDMIEKCLENREAIVREIRKMENIWNSEEYIKANVMNEVESTGINGLVDIGMNVDGKVVKIGTAFVINPKIEEGKSLIAVMSIENGSYPLVQPCDFKTHSILSYPWNLMRRNTENNEEVEKNMEQFATHVPDESDVGKLNTFIKANSKKHSLMLMSNSKKRSIEEVDESLLVEKYRKLVKLSNQLKKENEELREAQQELENENLKQKKILRALKAVMETADL